MNRRSFPILTLFLLLLCPPAIKAQIDSTKNAVKSFRINTDLQDQANPKPSANKAVGNDTVSQMQTEDMTQAVKPARMDTAYIADYTTKLTGRLFVLFQDAQVMNSYGDFPTLKYSPNVNIRFGIAGFYKWIGLAASIGNIYTLRDPHLYGRTSSVDLRVNAFGSSVAAELFYQSFRGFYITNITRENGTYYMLPDMATLSMGAAGFYIYNHQRYSMRAAYIQNERQKKSAGSLLIRPSMLYSRINSNQGIIPVEIIEDYHIPQSMIMTNVEFYSIGLSPGYSYTFVFFKNAYLSGTVSPGIAAQFYTLKSLQSTWYDFEFSFKLGIRIAAGYNSERWFLGGAFQTSFNTIPDRLSNTQFDYDISMIRLWGGARFDIFKKKNNRTFAP